MPAIVSGGPGKVTVVEREARTVVQRPDTQVVEVPGQTPTIASVETQTLPVKTAAPGQQGPKGDPSAVLSINGQIGDVILDAPDVNADPEGAAIAAASSAMAMHLADPDPHGQYVADGDVLNGGNF